MTAARLREAATVLRERAEAATPGRWAHCYTASDRHWIEGPGEYDGYDDTIATGPSPQDAAYIATMAPPVALALADWLDAEAHLIDGANEYPELHTTPNYGRMALMEALTNAILGDAS